MFTLGSIAASCGKSGKGIVSKVDTRNQDSAVYGAHEPGDRVAMSVAGPLGGEFVFEPLNGDGTPDEKGENAYQLKLEPGDGEGGSGSGGGDFGLNPTIELTITAKKDMGNSWKYALGTIEYDPEKYNPVEFIPGDLFGDDEKDVLNAALFQEKGRIAFWCGLKNFDKKDAKPGGDIGTFVIELAPWEPPKDASRAPDDEIDGDPPDPLLCDKVDDLQYDTDPMPRVIYWSEVNRGDGNLDGEVGVADITPLALSWQEHVPPSYNEVIDYYSNNYIYWDDYDIVGKYYTTTIIGYLVRVYADANRQTLLFSTNVWGPSTQTRTLIVNEDNLGRDHPINDFWYHSTTGQVGYIFRDIRFDNYDVLFIDFTPYDREIPIHAGVVSDLFMVDFRNSVNIPPTAFMIASYQNDDDCVVGKVPFEVAFDATGSTDSDGTIMNYEWDLDGDGIFNEANNDEDDAEGDPTVQYEYFNVGIYQTAVRVTDDDSATSVYTIQVYAKEYLNEVGFNNGTVEWLCTGTGGVETWYIGVQYRDLELDMSDINSVVIQFSGDTDRIVWPDPETPYTTDDIKPWDNQSTVWSPPISGLLDPLAPNGPASINIVIWLEPNLRTGCSLSFTTDLEVPSGSSDVAFEMKFRVLEPHEEIYLDLLDTGNAHMYSNLENNHSYPTLWSAFPYEMDGYSHATCPASP